MKNIPMTVNSKTLLPDCWLYQNKHFLLHSLDVRLPSLPSSYESVLKDLKIPYRLTFDELLEYWDPSNYKEEDLTLPLYASLPDGTYRFAKNYTGKIPTKNSIIAAKKLIPKVDKAVQDLDLKILAREQTLLLKDWLHGRKAAGFSSYRPKYYEENFITDEDYLKILPVNKLVKNGSYDYCKSATGCYVVFDVNKIELNSELDLQVPKGKEGLFIGKNGWQLKEWCKKLGLKRINVVGI